MKLVGSTGAVTGAELMTTKCQSEATGCGRPQGNEERRAIRPKSDTGNGARPNNSARWIRHLEATCCELFNQKFPVRLRPIPISAALCGARTRGRLELPSLANAAPPSGTRVCSRGFWSLPHRRRTPPHAFDIGRPSTSDFPICSSVQPSQDGIHRVQQRANCRNVPAIYLKLASAVALRIDELRPTWLLPSLASASLFQRGDRYPPPQRGTAGAPGRNDQFGLRNASSACENRNVRSGVFRNANVGNTTSAP